MSVSCGPRGSVAPPPPPPVPAILARTHQLLQVLLRELRIAVPLLLELVAGGFRHHHHPRGAEAAICGAPAARQLAWLPVPQAPPCVRARAPQSSPATRHAPAAAQQEAPVASHGPRGCGCRIALPSACTAPGAQRLSAGTCARRATSGDVPRRWSGLAAPGRTGEGGLGWPTGGGFYLFVYLFPLAPAQWPPGSGPTSFSTSSGRPLCARPQVKSGS